MDLDRKDDKRRRISTHHRRPTAAWFSTPYCSGVKDNCGDLNYAGSARQHLRLHLNSMLHQINAVELLQQRIDIGMVLKQLIRSLEIQFARYSKELALLS